MKELYENRFKELIKEGKHVLTTKGIDFLGSHEVERAAFVEWKTKVVNLLTLFIAPKTPLGKTLDNLAAAANVEVKTRDILSFLVAVYDDFKNGMFDNIQRKAEAAVTVDYLEQAEQLMKDKDGAQHTHIAAAVLAGSALEKCLRTLCQTATPPISVVKSNGKSKTLSPLIDDLVKANVFNELMAKQLRAWTDIRNAAAHGRYNEFNRDQVALMLSGVDSFLVNYMK